MQAIYNSPPPAVLSKQQRSTLNQDEPYWLEAVIWEVSPFMQISCDAELQVSSFTAAAAVNYVNSVT